MAEDVRKQVEEEAIACIDKALQKGYEIGYNDGKKFNEADFDYNSGREKGREEAWEAAKKIVLSTDGGGLPYDTLITCFGTTTFEKIFKNYTPSEAIDRIKRYEKKQEDDKIKVGDEVVFTGTKFVIINDEKDNDGYIVGISSNYRFAQSLIPTTLRKTGRTFPQIAEVLEQLKGGKA